MRGRLLGGVVIFGICVWFEEIDHSGSDFGVSNVPVRAEGHYDVGVTKDSGDEFDGHSSLQHSCRR